VAEGFWLDESSKCKKKALMAVKAASDRLLITLVKMQSAPTFRTTIEVRLVSGDVEATGQVVWTVRSSAAWLQLGNTTGTVHSSAPVAPVDVVGDATGLNDTFATGPLNATITLSSMIPTAGSKSVFEREAGLLTMPVELTIVAEIDIGASELRIQTDDGSMLLDNKIDMLPNAPEIEVTAEAKLTVTLKTFDYEQLPILRPSLRIEMELFMDGANGQTPKGAANLLFLSGNYYRVEVPGKWLKDAGKYTLKITGGNGAVNTVAVHLIVSSNQLQLYIALGISSVRPFAMLASEPLAAYQGHACPLVLRRECAQR
jgi:hypothetical protein